MAHLPSYLWDSAFDALEYQFPYVISWGRLYNVLVAVETLLLRIGCLLAVPRWKEVIPFGIVLVYGTLFFALNEVVPRYHMPIYCTYAAIAGFGYAGTVRSYFKRKTRAPAAAA